MVNIYYYSDIYLFTHPCPSSSSLPSCFQLMMLMLKMTALSANSFKIITQGINQHKSDTAQKEKSQCLIK